MVRSLKAIALTLSLLLIPASVFAQASIVGTVKDTSGAVLPGVAVEASSPVLIEKTRSVVTSGTGQYAIENLRPGLYTVTFELAGFATVRRTYWGSPEASATRQLMQTLIGKLDF